MDKRNSSSILLFFKVHIRSIVLHFSLALTFLQTGYSQINKTTYSITEVTKTIYLIEPIDHDYRWVTSNIILVINDHDALVVDSGLLPSAAAGAIQEIKKLTNKPIKYLGNTHWHGDHWQGNETFAKEYPGLQIISSERGLASINRNGMIWANQFYLRFLERIYKNFETEASTGQTADGVKIETEELAKMKIALPKLKADIEEIKNLKPVSPTITFTENLTLTAGSREIQLHYLGIGNTVGDAIVYLPKEKIIIAGDLVVYPSPYESGAFSKEWLETMKKLRAFDFQVLIPGHGEVQRDYVYLDYLISLFEEILRQLDQAYRDGASNIDEARMKVTHETISVALGKHAEFEKYLKELDPTFVSKAIRTIFQRVIEGKL
jgi:cyclase